MIYLKYVLKEIVTEKKDIFLSVLFGYLAGMTAIVLFGVSGYLVSKAALAPPLYTLAFLIAGVKLMGFFRALSRYGERYFSHRATFTMLSNIRTSFFEKLEPLAPRIFEKYRSGDLLARIVGDVENLQNFFLRVFYPPILLILVFLSTIFFVVFYSWWIALLIFIGLIMTGLIIPAWFTIRQTKMKSRMREARADLSTEATELLYGFLDLKIYRKLEGKEAQLTNASEAYIFEQEREGDTAMFNHAINSMASFTVSWLVLTVGAFLVTEGQLDGVFLAMLVMITLTMFENATPMAVLPDHLEDNRRAAERLYSVVEGSEAETSPPSSVKIPNKQALAIEFKKVSYTFPGERKPAIEEVSFQLPAGSKTAIVGPSGSGKSTLLQLLLGIFGTDNGEVYIEDSEVNHISKDDLWSKTNVVLQENHFFYGTIRENLLIAHNSLTDETLNSVLKKVELQQFSLDDQVLEKAENLSGGEKQRLAIARAMLKGERLWLLDEPASSIDALTEKNIYAHLLHQAQNDTLVLVSHRLTGLEKMDQIIVMEQGKVIEAGTYNELIDKKGYFYHMKQIEKDVLM
ncbi:thiol reductant ABC exporter subunit CydC [Thalassobacillus devorans]|uniref:Thiol reductant ABC exporter subunit CydC n=1 Tax=Thalassobacillus devorans TaxID=279813 RepID=A0ABQ1NN90_9BACI|nr:thiol reductant ABC exporter subunit CydC [Thalassobacillus devorans]NIK29107.1 ATP-binding cassette subfamily C protein CydC [Thalassobacillus devorans]GGC81117.1 thiol reductant ABC exporter subunit CydC [Thalassobacillus devorans]